MDRRETKETEMDQNGEKWTEMYIRDQSGPDGPK